jgi:hypothetical protein
VNEICSLKNSVVSVMCWFCKIEIIGFQSITSMLIHLLLTDANANFLMFVSNQVLMNKILINKIMELDIGHDICIWLFNNLVEHKSSLVVLDGMYSSKRSLIHTKWSLSFLHKICYNIKGSALPIQVKDFITGNQNW